MKLFKSIIITLIVLIISLPATAQMNVGGGLAFGLDVESLGITAKASKAYNDKISISPSFTFFLSGDYDLFELNGDGHYFFSESDVLELYGLAGLNYSKITIETNSIFGNIGGSELGLNIGAGALKDLNESMKIYAEAKYVLSGFDQLVINAGIYIPIGD